MVHAICRACRWSVVVGEHLPDSCERCESPFFYYRRVNYDYVLTDADRTFLRAGGIAPDDVEPRPDLSQT